MVNKVHLLGYLGDDPQIKTTRAGQRYAQLSLATSEYWRDRESGERKKSTDWHRIMVWSERLVELLEKYGKKGSMLWVEGRLSQRTWADDAGKKHWVTEVVIQGFGGVIKLMDKRKGGGVPEPGSEEDYGDVSKMESVYA